MTTPILHSFDLVPRLDLLHDGERLVYMNSLEIFLENRSRYAALFSFTFLSFFHLTRCVLFSSAAMSLSFLKSDVAAKYTLAYHRRIQF